MGPLNREPLIFRPVRPFAWIITRQTQHIELYINHQSIYPLSPLCPYHCAVLSSGPFPGHLVLLVDWSVISLDIKSISKLIATFTSFWFQQHLRRGESRVVWTICSHTFPTTRNVTHKRRRASTISSISSISATISSSVFRIFHLEQICGVRRKISLTPSSPPHKKKKEKKKKKKVLTYFGMEN